MILFLQLFKHILLNLDDKMTKNYLNNKDKILQNQTIKKKFENVPKHF